MSMNVLVMTILGGLLCTQLANPFLIWRFFKGCFLCLKSLMDKRKKNEKEPKQNSQSKSNKNTESKFKFEIMDPVAFWIQQAVFFVIGAGVLGLWYYLGAPDRTISQLIASIWVSAILHIFNCEIDDEFTGTFSYNTCACKVGMITAVCALFISIGYSITSEVYNFNHPMTANTYIQEAEVPVLDASVLQTLEKETVIEGITLSEPKNRDGNVVLLMEREGNVSLPGYILVKDGVPEIIRKDMIYTDNHFGANNVAIVARNYMPTKIFFGDWTFQLSDEGEVYFANMYGEYTFMRGGRDIQGVLLVNAETGKCSSYELEEIPSWIDGISE